MSILRSKTISHFQIVLPRENAYRVVGQLGRIGNAQLSGEFLIPNDMPFFLQSKICEEQLEKIKIIEVELHKQGHPLPKDHFTIQQYNAFLEDADRRYRLHDHSHIHLLEKMADELRKIWKNREDLQQRQINLEEQFQLLHEQMNLLEGGKQLFGDKLFDPAHQEDYQLKKIGFKCGIIFKRDELILKRTVFRISRGHSVLYTFQDNEDQIYEQKTKDLEKDMKQKKVFVYLFFGFGTSPIMQTKIQKMLDIYCVKTVDYPKNERQFNDQLYNIKNAIIENKRIQELVQSELKNSFLPFTEIVPSQNRKKFTKLEEFKLFFLLEKYIYQELNQMKLQHSFGVIEIYIEKEKVQEVTMKLQHMLAEDRMPIPQLIPLIDSDKPTLFQLNQYTRTPYQILTAYGVPQYKEINPAIFNLITFPFLFGVMFSDIAHGLTLFCLGVLMMLFPNYFEKSNVLKVILPHRVALTLMGFFAVYCGFVYNQFLSIGLDLFGSCYDMVDSVSASGTQQKIGIQRQGCVYPFGIDPIWSISDDHLQYTNSLKMKIAVIIAVVHMTVGIILKGLNQLFSRQKRFIFLETLPQLIFFVLLFGYMDFLIVFKWVNEWDPLTIPSIITTMINIPLKMGKTTNDNGGQPFWGDDYQTTSQNQIQLFILLISVLCLPCILCLKPIQIWRQNRKTIKNTAMITDDLDSDMKVSKFWQNKNINENLVEEVYGEGKIQMSEVIVHQIIETIEFALGCISNTASYLRLWALSLAHQQLAEVFFEETVQRGFTIGYIGVPVNVILFPIFAGITFGILICMDSMECFLHTLRLHWVQFQNKFYKGDGKPFQNYYIYQLTNEWIAANRNFD